MASRKQKIDWTTPSAETVKKAKEDGVYSTIYACKMQNGKGDLSGKYKWKVFCHERIADPEAFINGLNSKLIIGVATWQKGYMDGTPPSLVLDVFSKLNLRVVKDIIIELLQSDTEKNKDVFIHEPHPVKGDKDNIPPDTIELTLQTISDTEMHLTGRSIYLNHAFQRLEGKWDAEVKAVKFNITEELTKDFIIENLQDLCNLTGYTLTIAWYCEPAYVPTLNLQSEPPSDMLSLTELIELEEAQAQDSYHRRMSLAWHLTKTELDWLEWYNERPIVSVLRVLRALSLMGATREERKGEMCKLMSDNLYWEKWCVDSEWIID